MPDITKIRHWVVAGLIILGVGSLPTPVVGAVDTPSIMSPVAQTPSRGITISPSFKDITVSSGLIEANSNVTVTNNVGSDLIGTIRVVDFRTLGDFGGITFGQAGLLTGKYGLANWITLPSGDTIALPNGQATIIKVNIQNRADLAPGGHYGAVVVTTSSPPTAGSNNIKFKQELTSLLFVKKLGGEQFGLQLQSLTTDNVKDVPGIVSLKFGSTGNVYVIPRGYIDVTDSKGRLLAKGIINPESTLVLPETARIFTTTLHSVSGTNLPGSYTVTAYYRYDGQTGYTSKVVHITAQKLPIIVTAVAAIMGVIVLFGVYKYWSKCRAARRPKHR